MPYSENNYCKSPEYWRYISFRTMICEMIYQAVNLFPEIEEYTIICNSTSTGTNTTLQLGTYPDNIVAKLSNGEHYCDISKIDIVKIYSANRIPTPDNDKINNIIQILYHTGLSEPVISTSMIFSNKNMDKN